MGRDARRRPPERPGRPGPLWDALPGHDAALGWRVTRQDVWSKRVISRWANRVRNAVLGQSIRDTGCSVRIFPREVALRLPMFRGGHRFFGPLLIREGCSIVQVPVNHRPRSHGRSHYNLWNRSVRVVVDLLGVAWLMRRDVRYRVEAEPPTPAPHRSARRASVGRSERCRLATYETVWMGVGFLGQGIFTARFLVQWAVSEKRRDSVVPVAFWWISLFGGLTLAGVHGPQARPAADPRAGDGPVRLRPEPDAGRQAERRAARRRLRVEACGGDAPA